MSGTNPTEFKRFVSFLENNFGVEPTDTRYFTVGDYFPSWKDKDDRMSAGEALAFLEKHTDAGAEQTAAVGFVFEPEDQFLAVDEDNAALRENAGETFKPTFTVSSRSGGIHKYYLQPDNPDTRTITEDSIDAPDSYEETGRIADFRHKDVPKAMFTPGSWRPDTDFNGENAGKYTIADDRDATVCEFGDLPRSWIRAVATAEKNARDRRNRVNEKRQDVGTVTVSGESGKNAIAELDTQNVVIALGGSGCFGERGTHPVHGSKGGNNFIVQNGVAQCWRHETTLGALQLLALNSDRSFGDANDACEHLGKTHDSGGVSDFAGNPEELFNAWEQAKKLDLVDQECKVPYRCLMWAAEQAGEPPEFEPAEYDPDGGNNLTAEQYNAAIEWLSAYTTEELGREEVDPRKLAEDQIGAEELVASDKQADDLVKAAFDFDAEKAERGEYSKDELLAQTNDLIVQGIARQGKSHGIVQAINFLIRVAPDDDPIRVCYLLPSHEEGFSQWQKFVRMSGENGEVSAYPAYVLGQKKAAKGSVGPEGLDYKCTNSGEYNGEKAVTPWDAAQRLPDDTNQYQAHIQGAKDSSIVITSPEKLDELGDFDLYATTEEAVLNRIKSEEICLFNMQRTGSSETREWLDESLRSMALAILKRQDALEQTDQIHKDLSALAYAILDIYELVETYQDGVEENGFQEENQGEEPAEPDADGEGEYTPTAAVKDYEVATFDDLAECVYDRLGALSPAGNFNDTYRRLRNKSATRNHARKLMSVLYYDRAERDDAEENAQDAISLYQDGNRRQLYIIGDTTRIFGDFPASATYWFGGNDLPKMEETHRLIHDREVLATQYTNGYANLSDSAVVIRYSGGDNQKAQSGAMAKASRLLQNQNGQSEESADTKNGWRSGLLFGGSSQKSVFFASKMQGTYTPTADDTLRTVKERARDRMSVAIPENSRFAEGVDMEVFNFTTLYNARFATPREDYIADVTGDVRLRTGELIRAAQNAALRCVDVPTGEENADGNAQLQGEYVTPTLIPDQHVPEGFWDVLEAYGITVIDSYDVNVQSREQENNSAYVDVSDHKRMWDRKSDSWKSIAENRGSAIDTPEKAYQLMDFITTVKKHGHGKPGSEHNLDRAPEKVTVPTLSTEESTDSTGDGDDKSTVHTEFEPSVDTGENGGLEGYKGRSGVSADD